MLDDDGFMKVPEFPIEDLPFIERDNTKRLPMHYFVGNYVIYYDFGKYRMQTIVVGDELCVLNKLRWYIINVENDKALLISDKCVAWDFWCGDNALIEASKPCAWEESNVRGFLNGEFYEKAFSDEEKDIIMPLNESKDKVFVLSLEELEKNLPYEDLRRAETYFADDLHDLEVWLEPTCWWVNSVGKEENHMCIVSEDGKIDKYGRGTDADETGIRPAIWVDLKKLVSLEQINKGMIFAKKIENEYVKIEE